MGEIKDNHPGYPEFTRFDKKAKNMRYFQDADFHKCHWNDLTTKERDYWRGLVQLEEEDAKTRIQRRHERNERTFRHQNSNSRQRSNTIQQGKRRPDSRTEHRGHGHGPSQERPVRHPSKIAQGFRTTEQ